jgi:hypothetical protein
MKNKEEIINKVLKVAKEKDERLYIKCAEAFEIAKKFDVKPIVIGEICDEKKIKIKSCQLGCFK